MTYINHSVLDLVLMVGKDEKILWRSKPDKKCYVLEGIFNPFLPIAILWLAIDLCIISSIFNAPTNATNSGSGVFLLLFFAFHLMPVWIYLGGVIFIMQRYRNTEYIVTDKGVYISSGLFSYSCNMKPFAELARVNIHRGIIDQILGVGDVVLTSSNAQDFYTSNGCTNIGNITIENVSNYQKVFNLIKQLQEDVYTDTLYPNDLRPEENHGYQTRYNRNLDN